MARNIPVTTVVSVPQVIALSPIDVASFFDASSTNVANEEIVFVASGGGTVVLNLPAISSLPGGANNQKVGYVLSDNSTALTLQPKGTDTIANTGTGVAVAVTSGIGKGGRLQPLSQYVWDEQISK